MQKTPVKQKEGVAPGDIFCYSWGYDQTNVEFFQVLSLTKSGKSASLQKVKNIEVPKVDMMCGTTTPDKDNFKDGSKPLTKRITESSWGELVFKMDHGRMVKWDGTPKHYSTWA
jgi:hypothetical protein